MQRYEFFKDIDSYTFRKFRSDLISALSVAFLTIPQAVAYSLLAGLPPICGLYSAIFGTFITALFSTSRYLIAGPSSAIAILTQAAIASTLTTYYPGISGAMRDLMIMKILMQIVLIAGALQLLLAFLNVKKVLQFVSRSAMLGYFCGLMLTIVLQQLFYFLGITPSKDVLLYKLIHLFHHVYEVNFTELSVGGISLALLLLCKRYFPRFPLPLFLIVSMGAVAFFLSSLLPNMSIATLGKIEKIEFGFALNLPWFDFALIQKIFPAAASIAFLGILEAYTVSRTVSSEREHFTNQEVFAIGFSNFFLSFLPAAIPSSASISRTLLGVMSGAKTRITALLSTCFVALTIFFFSSYIAYIPLSTLAALLLVSALSIVSYDQVRFALRATKEDAFVFLLTLSLCFIFSLDVAFIIGIILSIATYLRKAAEPHLVEYAFNRAGRLSIISPEEDKHPRVRILGVGGELFFGVVDVLQKTLLDIAADPNVKVIILRFNGVYHTDASMCYAILRLSQHLQSSGRHLIISGLTEKVWSTFYKSKLIKKIGQDNLFLTDETRPQLSTWKACLRAQELLGQE